MPSDLLRAQFGNVTKASCRFVVVSIESEQGDRLSALLKSLCPNNRQGGITQPWPRLDHGYLPCLDLLDQVKQPEPGNQARCRLRRQEFRGEELRFTDSDQVIPANRPFQDVQITQTANDRSASLYYAPFPR